MLAFGKRREIPALVFTKLRAEQLVHYDGTAWAFADEDGRLRFDCD